jgi:hypothetical protein
MVKRAANPAAAFILPRRIKAAGLLVLLGACATARDVEPVVATFSIVARDPGTGELGIAVQSKFVAVGSVVPWAKAGVGAIATQSYANTTYGLRAARPGAPRERHGPG